jgi:hypothetical protein
MGTRVYSCVAASLSLNTAEETVKLRGWLEWRDAERRRRPRNWGANESDVVTVIYVYS